MLLELSHIINAFKAIGATATPTLLKQEPVAKSNDIETPNTPPLGRLEFEIKDFRLLGEKLRPWFGVEMQATPAAKTFFQSCLDKMDAMFMAHQRKYIRQVMMYGPARNFLLFLMLNLPQGRMNRVCRFSPSSETRFARLREQEFWSQDDITFAALAVLLDICFFQHFIKNPQIAYQGRATSEAQMWEVLSDFVRATPHPRPSSALDSKSTGDKSWLAFRHEACFNLLKSYSTFKVELAPKLCRDRPVEGLLVFMFVSDSDGMNNIQTDDTVRARFESLIESEAKDYASARNSKRHFFAKIPKIKKEMRPVVAATATDDPIDVEIYDLDLDDILI